MIEAKFLDPAQRAELEQIVHRPSEDHGVARRANAILLLDDGWSRVQVGKALYIDDDTVRNWHKHYLSGGLDLLTTFDWKGGLTSPITSFIQPNPNSPPQFLRFSARLSPGNGASSAIK
jgi:Homeodomain-like domain-containing protein